MDFMDVPQEYADRIRIADNGCWIWTGWYSGVHGGTGSKAPCGLLKRDKRVIRANRYFYELATGINPGRLHIRHRCDNTLCVNPDHLECNLQRSQNPKRAKRNERDACPHGHPYAGGNAYIGPNGYRRCRACNRARYHERKRLEQLQQLQQETA